MTRLQLSNKIADLITEAQAEMDAFHFGTAALHLRKASELLAAMQRSDFNQAVAAYAKREGLPYDH